MFSFINFFFSKSTTGEISCNVEKWCDYVDTLTSQQKSVFFFTKLHSMLDIPRIGMRQGLLHFMMDSYHVESGKFVLPDTFDELTAGTEEIDAILGLVDFGDDIFSFINKNGLEAQTRIPPHFLNMRSGEIEIDDLIASNNAKHKPDDNEFIQKSVLILLGTLLAPHSRKYVPKSFYCLVENVDRIPTFNWNAFVLGVLMKSIIKLKKEKKIHSKWPKGNLVFIQVLRNYISI